MSIPRPMRAEIRLSTDSKGGVLGRVGMSLVLSGVILVDELMECDGEIGTMPCVNTF